MLSHLKSWNKYFFYLDTLKYFQIVLYFILPFTKHFISKTSIHPCYLYVPLYMTENVSSQKPYQ